MFAKVVVALVAGGFGKHLAHRVGMMIADNGFKLTGNQSVKVGDMPEATWNPMCFCFCWRQVFVWIVFFGKCPTIFLSK